MNKTQIDTITKTLNERVQNHYKQKSDAIAKTVKPSKEAEKLSREFKNAKKKFRSGRRDVHAGMKCTAS